MKKTKKPTNTRTGLDAKLVAMPLHERNHFLDHGRTFDQSYLSDIIRQWRLLFTLVRNRNVPDWEKEFAAAYKQAESMTAGFTSNALLNWEPTWLERLAAEMRLFTSGKTHSAPTVADSKLDLRRRVFDAANGPVNCYKLAHEIEGVKNRKTATDTELANVERTRKDIEAICRYHKLPMRPRGWQKD